MGSRSSRRASPWRDWSTSRSLVCRPQEVTSQLYERGYTIRYVEYAPCTVSARASVGWWNTEEEVARLANAIADLANELRGSD